MMKMLAMPEPLGERAWRLGSGRSACEEPHHQDDQGNDQQEPQELAHEYAPADCSNE